RLAFHHIHFPNTSVGWVCFDLPGVREEKHLKAQGDVLVPTGVALKLELSAAAIDQGLEFLSNVSPAQIRGLSFTNLEIGDQHIKYLSHFKDINKLEFGSTDITDKGLKELVAMFPDVRSMSVARTRITSKSIPVIANGWRQVSRLVLSGIK